MDYVSLLIAIILSATTVALVTLCISKKIYAKKAGVIMKRMCTCSQDERDSFGKLLAQDSNSFGTDIFHLFD